MTSFVNFGGEMLAVSFLPLHLEPPWIVVVPLIVVMLFAVVQSLFGVGLLVFGTPTLLLAGFTFERSLALLLPASACISAAQLWQVPDRKMIRWSYLAWALPFVVVALVAVLQTDLRVNARRLVGTLLLVSALLRWLPQLRERLRVFLGRHLRVYLALMGLVHGASNMGGGLLTIMTATLHPEKEPARANIAAVYLGFALIQLGVLALTRPAALDFVSAAAAGGALVSFAVGNWIFRRASPGGFQAMLATFMFVYGLVLLL